MAEHEWVRMVHCAHCGSADIVGLVPDLVERTTVTMMYRCNACEMWTVLTAHTHDGGKAYVTRATSNYS
jgi:hypothetical protein